MSEPCCETHLFRTHLFLQLGEARGSLLLGVGAVRARGVAAALTARRAFTDHARSSSGARHDHLRRLVWYLSEAHLKHVLRTLGMIWLITSFHVSLSWLAQEGNVKLGPAVFVPWRRPRDRVGCTYNNLRTLIARRWRSSVRLGTPDRPSFSATH